MIFYIILSLIVLYNLPILIDGYHQFRSLKRNIKQLNNKTEISSYIFILRMLFRASILKFKQYLFGTEKNGKLNIVNFYHNYTHYSIPLLINRGPKNKYRFFTYKLIDDEIKENKKIDKTDITSIFSKFLGPNNDMYNITNLTPSHFSLPNLIVFVNDDKEYVYDSNESITCFKL